MNKIIQKIGLGAIALLASANVSAQCPTITCPGDMTVSVDPGTCGAVVNYTTPVGTDACSVGIGGDVLVVADGTGGAEVAPTLISEGYNVTVVTNDFSGGDNTVLQGAGLSAYGVIYWHTSNNTHNVATFTNLTNYVNAGGAVFVHGYDAIASPTDPELITFLGGTTSADVPGNGGLGTIVGPANSLTDGVTNIVGLTLSNAGDHDALVTLTAGTVGVAANDSGWDWSLRTLGAGEIAWVSTGQNTGALAAWTTPGSGYHEALLNFTKAHTCSGGNFLFVCDGDNSTATEIPAELIAAGHTVTSIYDDHDGASDNNTVLQSSSVYNYDAIFWHASGEGGSGDLHTAATFTNLEAYVAAGGSVFVTGYDVIASPTDPNLIAFMGGSTSGDGSPNSGLILGPSNSINDVDFNIIGNALAYTGDHDRLMNLLPGTVGIVQSYTATEWEWSLRSTPGGEVAWVSTANYGGQPWPAWNTVGSNYREALLNFASSNACGSIGIGNPTTTMTAGLADGATFPVGATTVTYEVVDGLGNNPQTCSFIVTVVDDEAPLADNPSLADATGECDATPVAPTGTDNCAGALTATPDVTFPITAQGTTVVTWTYDDGNGNVSNQTQNVVLTDVTAPVEDVMSLTDFTAACDVTPVAPTATDNCVGVVIGTPDVTFPITAAGTTIVTWTYDDGYGNTTTQAQNVIVTGVNTGVSQVGTTLTADAAGATYQWLDCDNGYSVIAGETNASFTPTATVGNYAVEITDNGCVDTSACFVIDYTGLTDLDKLGLSIYPNPNSGNFFVESVNGSLETITITDNAGREVYSISQVSEVKTSIEVSELSRGVYFVNMTGEFGTIVKEIVIQ